MAKQFRTLTLFLLFLPSTGWAGDSGLVITPGMFNPVNEILICKLDGWEFRKEGDSAWVTRKPTELTASMTNQHNRLDGWLRFRFVLDSSFGNTVLGLRYAGWAAAEVYVDGIKVSSFGVIGTDASSYREYNPSNKMPVPLQLTPGVAHEISIRFADYRSPLTPGKLKSQSTGLHQFIRITGPGYQERLGRHIRQWPVYSTFWVSTCTVLTLLFWMLAFLNRKEKNLTLFAVCATLFLVMFCFKILSEDDAISFNTYQLSLWGFNLFSVFSSGLSLIIVARIFKDKVPGWLKITVALLLLQGIVNSFFGLPILAELGTLIPVFIYIKYIISSRKTLKGAQWAIVTGLSFFTVMVVLYIAMLIRYQTDFFPNNMLVATGLILSFPLALLVYVALRFKEVVTEVRQQAEQVLKLSEEKKDQAVRQQKLLEDEVARQTVELRTSLENLKAAQHQLVQSEKMASLGELTAGIAHEIQNPLNFVNNFSEVNAELIAEMKQEIDKGNLQEVKSIANSIDENEQKIMTHGKRADAIVKGMLQHSRSSSGVKDPTDINALADEYLRLAYHGLRAKDKGFNATMKTDFDESIGKINIIPQDIGRVILNLITNAFYVVNEKKILLRARGESYEPTVTVRTRKNPPSGSRGGEVLISVIDNGNGIPQKVVDKIFQPFFTTKPAGQGTGLGLSLSYDIVKAHGGEIKVSTVENEGTEFTITLPV